MSSPPDPNSRGAFMRRLERQLVARMERSEMRGHPGNPHDRSRISLRSIRATGFSRTHGSLTTEYLNACGSTFSVRPAEGDPGLGDVRVDSALKTRVNALTAPGSPLSRGRTESQFCRVGKGAGTVIPMDEVYRALCPRIFR